MVYIVNADFFLLIHQFKQKMTCFPRISKSVNFSHDHHKLTHVKISDVFNSLDNYFYWYLICYIFCQCMPLHTLEPFWHIFSNLWWFLCFQVWQDVSDSSSPRHRSIHSFKSVHFLLSRKSTVIVARGRWNILA